MHSRRPSFFTIIACCWRSIVGMGSNLSSGDGSNVSRGANLYDRVRLLGECP